MSALTLKEAYDTAFAVFSPHVEFIEWTIFQVQSDRGGWGPFEVYKRPPVGSSGLGRLLDKWKEIESARWIYVFRKAQEAKGALAGPAVLVDELFLDEKKHLHATKLNAAVAVKKDPRPERSKTGVASHREPKVEIGTTVSFVRQLLGKPLVHYFFASRIQLPNKAIDELQNHIAEWAPGVTFEPTDPNIDWRGEGQNPRVPVLDPITIATHLHAYFCAASDDLIKYQTPVHDDDPDDPYSEERKKRAKERQKKFLLAQIVSSLLDADGTLVGKEDSGLLYSFQQEYAEQIKYRKEWRDRWATYLCNWLKARPILLLAHAHQFDEEGEFPGFLLQMAHCHSRLCETECGRDLLRAHFEQDRFSWVQKYVLGREPEPVGGYRFQIIRRAGFLAGLEFLKEHVPVWVPRLAQPKVTVAQDVSEVLGKMLNVKVKPEKLTKFLSQGRKDVYVVWGKKGWEDFELAEVDMIDVIGRRIADYEPELKPPWKGAVGTLLEGIELINFALALHGFYEKWKGEELQEKIWAFLELTEASAHLGATTLVIFGKASTKTIAKLVFVAAVIDAIIGGKEAVEALEKGKYGKALGSGIVTAGSLVLIVGFFSEAAIFGPLGFLIMGAGFLIQWLTREDTDFEKFIDSCAFGEHRGDRKEKPGWYETKKKFADWDNDLDEQVRAALFLLSKFKIESTSFYTTDSLDDTVQYVGRGKIKMGWVPRGAKLHLQYAEEWLDPKDSRSFTAEIDFGDGEKPTITSSKLDVKPEEHDRTLVVQAPKSAAKDIYGSSGVHISLKKITLTGSLEVNLDGTTFFVHPDEKETLLLNPPR